MKYSKKELRRGYCNRMITIDVGSRHIRIDAINEKVRDYFIGGRALGLYLLYRRINGQVDARDPGNPLIFSPGPLGGIPQFPGTSKCMAISLSPLTGIAGISNFGGHFGAFIKYAGFDVIELTGKSDSEVLIVIDSIHNEIQLIDAPQTDDVFKLEQRIVDKFTSSGFAKKNIAFVTTGIGASSTNYGCINSHYYDPTKFVNGGKGLFRTKQAGRTGLGSVLRDKKVSSIVILAEFPNGENPFGAADWDKVKKSGASLMKVIKEVDPKSLQMHRRGSAGLISFMNQETYRSLPVNNYQLGTDPRAENISGNLYGDRFFDHRGMDGCFPGCSLQCTKGGWVCLTTGDRKNEKVWVDGPEYETAVGFGANLGIWNPEFIMEANWHCDNYGIDTITTSVIIAFLMECFQKGYLSGNDMDGLELTWGNETAVMDFIHSIAAGRTEPARQAGKGMINLMNWVANQFERRTGKRCFEELTAFAMQSKGLPFSLYRTHGSLSMQASYAAASDTGAHHAAAWLIKIDLLGAFPTLIDKAKALVNYPRVRLGNDNLGLCKLPWVDVFNPASEKMQNTDIYLNPASQEIYADLYNGMIGTNLTWEQIYEQTDRDINLQRVMNAAFYGKDTGKFDWIPDRAIGPTDDSLYEAEKEYNDSRLCEIPGKFTNDILGMSTAEKRKLLMDHRKSQLKELIQTYYRERGWNENGIPQVDTLDRIGLWAFLSEETKAQIIKHNG